MRSFAQFLAEDIKDVSDEAIRQVLDLLTPEELALLDNPSPETNKKIFRRLAKELHPDVTGRAATEVELNALRIFGREEASNAKTFDRVKQVKQARANEAATKASTAQTPETQGTRTQAAPQATTGRPKTAEEIRAEAAAQRAKEWRDGEAWSREDRERVQREAKAKDDARAAKAQADAAEANRARVGREQAEAAKKARTGQAAQPQTPPQPPPSIKDAVSSSSAVGGEANAAQRFGRKTVDVAKKVYNVTKQGAFDFGLAAGRETAKVGQDVAQGGFGLGGGKAPVSLSGKALPIGSGVDLGLKVGMDLYDISKDPQWIYKAPTYSDAIKNELKGIGISTGIGAGIGGLVGGPAGAGAGAVAGALEGIATAGYGLAQVPMKMGYSERQTLDNLKARLETEKTLLKNNPEADATENYSGSISALERAIKEMEKGESFESKLSKGVDSAFSAVQNTPVTVYNPASWAIGLAKKTGFIPGTDDEVRAQETRTPEQLRADAEAAFEKRYPQGIRGGLAPGKSAAEVEKEAATDIINRLNAGANPQDLAKELGWETDEQVKARQERAEKSIELMVSDPEKYGKMGETALDAAAAAKVSTDRTLRVLDQLKASRDARDAEHQAVLKAIEDAVAKKELEIADKRKMDDLTHQQKMDALAINTGLAKEKLDRTKKELEDRRALFMAGEESKKRRKEEERAISDARRAKRKKEFDAKMAQMDKSIAGFDAQMGSYDARGLPIL